MFKVKDNFLIFLLLIIANSLVAIEILPKFKSPEKPSQNCEIRGGKFQNNICTCLSSESKKLLSLNSDQLCKSGYIVYKSDLNETIEHECAAFGGEFNSNFQLCKCNDGSYIHPLVSSCYDLKINESNYLDCPKSSEEWHELYQKIKYKQHPQDKLIKNLLPYLDYKFDVKKLSSENKALAFYNLIDRTEESITFDEALTFCQNQFPMEFSCKNDLFLFLRESKLNLIPYKRGGQNEKVLFFDSEIQKLTQTIEDKMPLNTFQYGFKISDKDYFVNNKDKIGIESLLSVISLDEINLLRQTSLERDVFHRDTIIANLSNENRKALFINGTIDSIDGHGKKGRIYIFKKGTKCDHHVSMNYSEKEKIPEDLKYGEIPKQLSMVVVCHHDENGNELTPQTTYIQDYWMKGDKNAEISTRHAETKNVENCMSCHFNGYLSFHLSPEQGMHENEQKKFQEINDYVKKFYKSSVWGGSKSKDKSENLQNKASFYSIGVNLNGNRQKVIDSCIGNAFSNESEKIKKLLKKHMQCNDCHNGNLRNELLINHLEPGKSYFMIEQYLSQHNHPDYSNELIRNGIEKKTYDQILKRCLILEAQGGELFTKDFYHYELIDTEIPDHENQIIKKLSSLKGNFNKSILNCDPTISENQKSKCLNAKEIFDSLPSEELLDFAQDFVSMSESLCTTNCTEPTQAILKYSNGELTEINIENMKRYDPKSQSEVEFNQNEKKIIANWVKSEAQKGSQSKFYKELVRDFEGSSNLLASLKYKRNVDGVSGATIITDNENTEIPIYIEGVPSGGSKSILTLLRKALIGNSYKKEFKKK